MDVAAVLFYRPPRRRHRFLLGSTREREFYRVVLYTRFVPFRRVTFRVVYNRGSGDNVKTTLFCLPTRIGAIPIQRVCVRRGRIVILLHRRAANR